MCSRPMSSDLPQNVMYPRPSCNDLLGFPVPRGTRIVRYVTDNVLFALNNFNCQRSANRFLTLPAECPGVAQYGTKTTIIACTSVAPPQLLASPPRYLDAAIALTAALKKIARKGFRRGSHEGLAPCKGAVRATFTTTIAPCEAADAKSTK